MPTMIYSPGIKVYIDTENDGTIDVSEDLTEGNMVRRSDGVSTFTFSIQNTRRKYDGKFTPNDRIVVLMKRLTWVQVFTGYLNSVPLITAWPKVVNVSASCSLKRLQYWYWDPYSPAAYQLTYAALLAVKNGDNENTDGGLTNLILNVLDQVVGWPKSKVHIGRIPPDWMEVAKRIAEEVADEAKAADAVSKQYQETLGINAVIGGKPTNSVGAVARGSLPAGTYAGITLTQQQADLAYLIYAIGATTKGITEWDIVTALMTAYQESKFNENATDGVSYGLFQQTPPWWGTKAQVYDPDYATRGFYEALKKVANRDKMSHIKASHIVQQSAYPEAPAQWEALAEAIVAKLQTTGNTKVDPSRSQGVATGAALATYARQLVQDHPNIRYSQDTFSPLNQYPPPYLDCSLLVKYVYHQTLGLSADQGGLAGARDVGQIMGRLTRRISVKEALQTIGAVIVRDDGEGDRHIELCVGGNFTVATNTSDLPARLRDYNPNSTTGDYDITNNYDEYDFGGLLPGITYDGVGTATSVYGGARSDNQGYAVDTGQGSYDTQTPAPGGEDDFFNSLFGKAGFTPVPADAQQLAQAASLTGIRALLNDQPMLGGFLKNVINASLRSFCSAPNGDLIAWFPDYYGLWGTAATMVVETIELLDFEVNWSDDFFVTHQFTVLGWLNQIDVASGESSVQFGQNANLLALNTYGLANIDVRAILEAIFGIAPTQEDAEKFAQFIYRKFGARPDYQVIDGMISNNDKRAEFFSALYLFMRQWAYQYNASVPLTFMPELWPGMLLQVPAFDFQGYITTVTHSFQFGPGGGFSTTVNLAAPARIAKDGQDRGTNALIGLPLAGGLTPGLSGDDARRALRPAIEPTPSTPFFQNRPGQDGVE